MRHTRIVQIAAFVATAWISIWPSPAEACSCSEPGPPCAAFWQADTVFLGRVMSIESTPRDRDSMTALRVQFSVQRMYRGGETTQIAIHTSPGETSCGYPFRSGETYVVYANRSPQGTLVTTTCSRTRRASVGVDDLAYGHYATNTPSGFRSRIAGTIYSWGWSGVDKGATVFAGLRVSATSGDRQFSTMSSVTGEYVLADVPPGKYILAAEAPPGYEPVVRQLDVNDPHGCGPSDIALRPDGRVSGRVVDSRGNPVGGLPLDLVVADERDLPGGSYKRVSAWTAADGTFEFRLVPRGEYVLGFNAMRSQDGRLTLPRAFYPGVVDAHVAGTINVGTGERVQLQNFVVPQEIRLTTIMGVVLGVDGRAVDGATVTLRNSSEGSNVIGREFKTKEDGRFAFAVVLGARYDLHASRRVTATDVSSQSLISIKYFTASAGLPIMTVVLKPSQQ